MHIEKVLFLKNGKTANGSFKKWLAFASFAGVIAVSVWLAIEVTPNIKGWEEYGYPGIFMAFAAVNATVFFILPINVIPFAISLAAQTDPFSVALVCSIGATLGESTSYFLGASGKGIARAEGLKDWQEKIRENSAVQRIGRMKLKRKAEKTKIFCFFSKAYFFIKSHEDLSVTALAFQPILPFDAVGIIAGSMKYSYWKFIVFCSLGRFFKYLIIIASGVEIGEKLSII